MLMKGKPAWLCPRRFLDFYCFTGAAFLRKTAVYQAAGYDRSTLFAWERVINTYPYQEQGLREVREAEACQPPETR